MGYFRNFILFLILITSASGMAQSGHLIDNQPIPQADPSLLYEGTIQYFSILSKTALKSSECKTPLQADKKCITLFRDENNGALVQPLLLLLMALGLIGLGIATRIK